MNLEIKLQKKLRLLTQGLFVSGFLNIFLVIFLAYFSLSERRIVGNSLNSFKKQQKKGEISNSRYLSCVYNKSFKELMGLLTDKELLEEGFCKRDLALGCLYTFHYFNVEKALFNQPLQKRQYSFIGKEGKRKDVVLFAGLSDEQFNTVIHYGCFEKWPFTAEGLFNLIKNSKNPDPSLLKAFAVTEEFYVLSSLFQGKTAGFLSPLQLIEVIRPCSFSYLRNFVSEQKQLLDADPRERRAVFLLGCMEEGSGPAAFLLLKDHRSHLLKKASDAQLLKIFSMHQNPCLEMYLLSVELIKSPRSSAVWQKSAQMLYAFVNEKPPEPFSRETVLNRFVMPNLRQRNCNQQQKAKKDEISAETSLNRHPPPKTAPKASAKKGALKNVFQKMRKKPEIYIVQKGDSLWKIAHKRRLRTSQLMQANNLKNSKLRPGQKLVIPQK